MRCGMESGTHDELHLQQGKRDLGEMLSRISGVSGKVIVDRVCSPKVAVPGTWHRTSWGVDLEALDL
jgi:hypothetical protein